MNIGGCMYLFELEFSPFLYIRPGVGLLDPIVTMVRFLNSFKKRCQLGFPGSRFWQQVFFRKCPWNPPCGREGRQLHWGERTGRMDPAGQLTPRGAGCGHQRSLLQSVIGCGCHGKGAPWAGVMGHPCGKDSWGTSTHSPPSSWNSKSFAEGGPGGAHPPLSQKCVLARPWDGYICTV